MGFRQKEFEKQVPEYIRKLAADNNAPLPSKFIPSAEAVRPTQEKETRPLTELETTEIENHVDLVLEVLKQTKSD